MQMFKELKDKTILLVEDEKVIRENTASTLKVFFKKVYTANDGYEALDMYEEYLPDILMTDLKMPNMNGLDLIDEIKKRAGKTYTMIVSAHTDTDWLIDAIHNGVDRYIVKPITEDELFEAFRAYLKKVDETIPKVIDLNKKIKVDLDKHLALIDTKEIHLNKKENQLLTILCADAQKTITYEEIEYQIWGSDSMSLSAIRSVVRDLRKKIGNEFVINVSGIGYRLK